METNTLVSGGSARGSVAIEMRREQGERGGSIVRLLNDADILKGLEYVPAESVEKFFAYSSSIGSVVI